MMNQSVRRAYALASQRSTRDVEAPTANGKQQQQQQQQRNGHGQGKAKKSGPIGPPRVAGLGSRGGREHPSPLPMSPGVSHSNVGRTVGGGGNVGDYAPVLILAEAKAETAKADDRTRAGMRGPGSPRRRRQQRRRQQSLRGGGRAAGAKGGRAAARRAEPRWSTQATACTRAVSTGARRARKILVRRWYRVRGPVAQQREARKGQGDLLGRGLLRGRVRGRQPARRRYVDLRERGCIRRELGGRHQHGTHLPLVRWHRLRGRLCRRRRTATACTSTTAAPTWASTPTGSVTSAGCTASWTLLL